MFMVTEYAALNEKFEKMFTTKTQYGSLVRDSTGVIGLYIKQIKSMQICRYFETVLLSAHNICFD